MGAVADGTPSTRDVGSFMTFSVTCEASVLVTSTAYALPDDCSRAGARTSDEVSESEFEGHKDGHINGKNVMSDSTTSVMAKRKSVHELCARSGSQWSEANIKSVLAAG